MDIKTVDRITLQKLYDESGRLKDLKKIFKCGIVVLKNRMIELGIVRKPITRTKVSISENDLREVCKNKTVNEISKFLKCDHSLTSKLMSKYNIPFKEKIIKRKHLVDENFFNELNSKSMYWLGFIAADGNVFKNRLSINLSNKDADHLQKFKIDISLSSDIETEIVKSNIAKPTKIAKIRINSKKIINNLAKLGIFPAKSLNFTIPDNILQHRLLNLFLLGFIDGDGCWSVKKNGQLSFSVCGSEKLCQQIKAMLICNELISDDYNYIKKQGKIWTLNISGNKQLLKISKWLYRGAQSFLKRKYSIIENHYRNHVSMME